MAGLTNLNPFIIVNCSTPESSQGLVFDDKELVIGHGSKVVGSMDMSSFFQPCATFLIQEFTLNSLDTTFIEPGNQGDPIMAIIHVIFPDPAGTNEDLKWITWNYPPSGPDMYMGRLTVISGATGNTWDLGATGGLQIHNPQGFPVGVRVMVLNGTSALADEFDFDDENGNPITG